jgi:hypothetical protein
MFSLFLTINHRTPLLFSWHGLMKHPNGPSLKLLNLVERNGLEILALTPSPPSKARGFTANLIKISFLKRVKKTALFLTRYATHVKEMAVFLTCLLFVQC